MNERVALCWGGPIDGELRAAPSTVFSVIERNGLPWFGQPDDSIYWETNLYRLEKICGELSAPPERWRNDGVSWIERDFDLMSGREDYFFLAYAWIYEPEREQQKQRILAGIHLIMFLCRALQSAAE